MTAAHCTEAATNVEVVLGAHDLDLSEPSQVRVHSESIITHEEFDGFSLRHDIGLIQLPYPVEISKKEKIL